MVKAAKTGATQLKQKSPAEFFAENKNIAGFDNAGKSLYTTLRELMENSLDSAENIGVLPELHITVQEVSKQELNVLRGVSNTDRVDEALYQDFETDAQRKKRETREEKQTDKLNKLIAEKGEGDSAVNAHKRDIEKSKIAHESKGTKLHYKVTVQDNGSGMPHAQIPDMLGKVLSGTKYGMQQTRGKFGLGAKMALIWSKMTTGMPFEIESAQSNQNFISRYSLDIDIHKNAPNVHLCKMDDNAQRWRGTKLSLVIEGHWQIYRAYILRYLRQIAVITPYAQFTFKYTAADAKNNVSMVFNRRTDTMPPVPKQVKYHPSSVDLELVKRLLHDTKCTSLRKFLHKDFSCISPDYAGRLIQEMQGSASEDSAPQELSISEATTLHQLLQAARFDDPDGGHLSPAGEYNLRLGVMKELKPDLIATHQGDVRIFEGHAFVVEAAVSIGGRNIKQGLNIHRFANRIPLLFEGGSDVVTRTAMKRINWSTYKINHTQDKVGVFVSIVSTKIPFKGAGKEYIGDDVDEMVAAVKLSIQQCCIQLKNKISRRQAAQEQKERKKNLEKYIPNAAAAVIGVLKTMSEKTHEPGPKRRRLQGQQDLLLDVTAGTLTQKSLERKLHEHVHSIDADMALEYQMQSGLKTGVTRDVFLAPVNAQHAWGPELHAEGAVIKFLA